MASVLKELQEMTRGIERKPLQKRSPTEVEKYGLKSRDLCNELIQILNNTNGAKMTTVCEETEEMINRWKIDSEAKSAFL